MTLFNKALLLADGIGVAAFALALVALLRWQPKVRSVTPFFLIWAAVWLFEYYFLGENSYIHMDDEGDHFVPYYMYLLNGHLGGQFGHHIGGGTDVYTALSPGIQLISPELVWFSLFPVWIAILIHKAIVVSVGFWGAYLLCRDTSKADALTCAAAGALFTVSTHNLLYITYSIGAALSFLPLAIYVFVVRSGAQRYWLYAIPTAIVTAVYLDPTHVVETMFAGIGLSAIMLKRLNFRVALSLILLFAAVLVNWAEPIYAMLQISPLTYRGSFTDLKMLSLEQVSLSIQTLMLRAPENRVTLLAFASLAVLWLYRDETRWRLTVGIAALFTLYVFLILFPFQVIGMGTVNNLSHHYVLLAITALTLLPLVRAAELFRLPGGSQMAAYQGVGGAVILALAIGMLVQFKVYNLANLLYHGGQNQYHSIAASLAGDWRPKEPFRVISLRVRDLGPEPGLTSGFYGLEGFDMFMMLEPKERTTYFKASIHKGAKVKPGNDPRLMVDWSRWRDGKYQGIGQQVSLPLLRAANVSFILSPLPMEEDGVRLVAGPKAPPMTRDARKEHFADYMKDRVNRLFDFPDLYVYALPDPYPQVYAADHLVVGPDAVSATQFLRKMEREVAGPGRVVFVRQSEKAALGATQTSLKVKKYARIKDGFTADTDAPDGGILVINTIAVPFWRATADGNPLTIVPVNHVQMGVQVPPGTREVRFAYQRPSVREVLRRFVF
ncbi:MAG: hypothetical protein HQ494_06925 [Rhodospirillales bacterium]|nr:hypothetical protein [Rhodospirillales bacterium]